MDAFFLLILFSIFFIIIIGAVLYWAVFSGQYDNVQKNARSILEDNDSINSDE
ncbi:MULTISPECIES: cbb3-type cytochrome oxidase assembly protein CcoS [Pelistega]|uniref:cbb3-type cytochrome oxidase assembly protein CcoS n=1 Tax=Pelistega TaxID=106146 RepID=UPI000402D578|nr:MULTISPECIES: cbb3-type cytochrome oxidase assembly protein CcoS [Pelistega]